jgi:antitoxin (DNA-binding transcriptional repressor) of toxin-antitoxin stability system
VTISRHGRPVAQIVAISRQTPREDLATQPGISWNGGKVAGLPRGEVMPEGIALSVWVEKGRR